jgi:hypothetical protein
MIQANERTVKGWLFHPSVYLAGGSALGVGLLAILAAGWIGWLGHTHFDGVLDMHLAGGGPLWFFLSDGLVDWLCLAVVLLIAGRIFSKTHFRVLDVLGTQAWARWPTLLTSLIALPEAAHRFGHYLIQQLNHTGGTVEFELTDAIAFGLLLLGSILLLIWTVGLMYRAYSHVCNVKSEKAVSSFVTGLIIAEVLSKVTLYWLKKWV